MPIYMLTLSVAYGNGKEWVTWRLPTLVQYDTMCSFLVGALGWSL